MCDKRIIYKGRKNVDQFKSAFAQDTELRTLDEAMVGSDVFLGLSAKDVVTKDMVKSMSKNPIILLVLILTQRLNWLIQESDLMRSLQLEDPIIPIR